MLHCIENISSLSTIIHVTMHWFAMFSSFGMLLIMWSLVPTSSTITAPPLDMNSWINAMSRSKGIEILPPICLDLATMASAAKAGKELFPNNATIITVNGSEYFITGETSSGTQRWKIAKDSMFALGKSLRNVEKVSIEKLKSITLVEGRSEEDEELIKSAAQSYQRLSRSSSWMFMQSLYTLTPGSEFKDIVRKILSRKAGQARTITNSSRPHLHHPHVTLIDVKTSTLPILRNSMTIMRDLAPVMRDSVIIIAYDADTCRTIAQVDQKNPSSGLHGIPCYYDMNWLTAIRNVTQNLPASAAGTASNEAMVGQLVTTLCALCQGASVFNSDPEVVLLQDPVALVPSVVDLMMTAVRYTTTASQGMLKAIVSEPQAALSLNDVVFYRATGRLIRWYAYYTEYTLSQLTTTPTSGGNGGGFLLSNFVEFFRQHRLKLYGMPELLSIPDPKAAAVSSKTNSTTSAAVEMHAGDTLSGHHHLHFNQSELEEMTSLASVSSHLAQAAVAGVSGSNHIQGNGNASATGLCPDCYFGTTIICPHSLVINGSVVDTSELSQCHSTGINAGKHRPGVPVSQTSFPLHVGVFAPYRWITCNTQVTLQNVSPTGVKTLAAATPTAAATTATAKTNASSNATTLATPVTNTTATATPATATTTATTATTTATAATSTKPGSPPSAPLDPSKLKTLITQLKQQTESSIIFDRDLSTIPLAFHANCGSPADMEKSLTAMGLWGWKGAPASSGNPASHFPTETSYPHQFVKGGAVGAPPAQKSIFTSPRIPFGKPPPLDFAGNPLPKEILLAPADPVAPVTSSGSETSTTKKSYKYSFAAALEYVNTHVIGPLTTESNNVYHRIEKAIGYGTSTK